MDKDYAGRFYLTDDVHEVHINQLGRDAVVTCFTSLEQLIQHIHSSVMMQLQDNLVAGYKLIELDTPEAWMKFSPKLMTDEEVTKVAVDYGAHPDDVIISRVNPGIDTWVNIRERVFTVDYFYLDDA